MNGGTQANTGVSLVSGSGLIAGDRVTLINGARQWRIRLTSTKESVDNVILFEVRDGTKWIIAASYTVPPS